MFLSALLGKRDTVKDPVVQYRAPKKCMPVQGTEANDDTDHHKHLKLGIPVPSERPQLACYRRQDGFKAVYCGDVINTNAHTNFRASGTVGCYAIPRNAMQLPTTDVRLEMTKISSMTGSTINLTIQYNSQDSK